MRLQLLAGLGLSAAVSMLTASCTPPAQPAYADISYQTRCIHLDGTPIMGCSTPISRDIYGFSGDMGQRFSCTIIEHAGQRAVNFTVTAQSADGTRLGLTLANASVPAAGGPVTGSCQFTWTDGNTYGGACGASAPTASQPCQVSNIDFTTDTATGLPLMDVNVLCLDAGSMPIADPPISRSLSKVGTMPGDEMRPVTIHFYSCPTIVR
jgi:hypothetical protein